MPHFLDRQLGLDDFTENVRSNLFKSLFKSLVNSGTRVEQQEYKHLNPVPTTAQVDGVFHGSSEGFDKILMLRLDVDSIKHRDDRCRILCVGEEKSATVEKNATVEKASKRKMGVSSSTMFRTNIKNTEFAISKCLIKSFSKNGVSLGDC
jgi:hypothetical protein